MNQPAFDPNERPLSTGARFERLVAVMAALRAEHGCPWDREQTHRSLVKYLIEETFEAVEAIETDDERGTIEELGDVLLQVVFHGQIGRDEGRYSIDDIVDCITDKLIERHPHVFGDGVRIHSPEEVLRQWETNKAAKAADRESITDGIPAALPALQQAYRVQQRVAQVGFDWDNIGQVFDKVREELAELESAHCAGDTEQTREELGDLFFALVNLARYLKIDPEAALRLTVRKFRQRFRFVEARVRASGKTLEQATLEEMDTYWEQAKRE